MLKFPIRHWHCHIIFLKYPSLTCILAHERAARSVVCLLAGQRSPRLTQSPPHLVSGAGKIAVHITTSKQSRPHSGGIASVASAAACLPVCVQNDDEPKKRLLVVWYIYGVEHNALITSHAFHKVVWQQYQGVVGICILVFLEILCAFYRNARIFKIVSNLTKLLPKFNTTLFSETHCRQANEFYSDWRYMFKVYTMIIHTNVTAESNKLWTVYAVWRWVGWCCDRIPFTFELNPIYFCRWQIPSI